MHTDDRERFFPSLAQRPLTIGFMKLRRCTRGFLQQSSLVNVTDVVQRNLLRWSSPLIAHDGYRFRAMTSLLP